MKFEDEYEYEYDEYYSPEMRESLNKETNKFFLYQSIIFAVMAVGYFLILYFCTSE